MLKKTIKYHDLDGKELVEDFYFNLSKAEIAEMELSADGGMQKKLMTLVASNDQATIVSVFKDILRKTIGKRSEDGKYFVKNEEITNAFVQSDAYSELFMELITDANATVKFMVGMLPGDLAEKVEKMAADQFAALQPPKVVDAPVQVLGAVVDTAQNVAVEYTQEELLAMPDEEFTHLFGDDPKLMTRKILVVAMQRKTREK